MERVQIDPEEMARRIDRDFIESLKMIGEGAPVYDSVFEEEVEEKELPRDYQ
ncbi:hypothetical protein [Sporosarcina sp. G11-34]|uniref:hypothetical protein n=1 Tax=Sporosarcina sp. G11-34 TaxID=2849605 RepID=UPI0022A94161|nr:hypothetical protein [Sporosarcina sp. G11-34]MCZ2259205.1 hypothetical protein [Sporosarcina sp. G11-34]